MAGLQNLLFLEVGSGIAADHGFIAHAGQPVEPDPGQSAETADRFRSQVLDIRIDIDRRADDIELADDVTRTSPRFRRNRAE